jgi:transposase
MTISRKPYPADVADEEWALIAPYLCLRREDAKQREHPLREVFNGLRYVVKNGIPGGRCPTIGPLGRQSTVSVVWRLPSR